MVVILIFHLRPNLISLPRTAKRISGNLTSANFVSAKHIIWGNKPGIKLIQWKIGKKSLKDHLLYMHINNNSHKTTQKETI